MRCAWLGFLVAMSLPSGLCQARPFDAEHPWFADASFGTVQPGLGSDFGAGQNYAAHLGFLSSPRTDWALSIAWAHARSNEQAIETDVASGGVRVRGWVGEGRWSPYGEASARLQSVQVEQLSVLAGAGDRWFGVGAHLGAGLLYSRSTWWAGLGAELHVSSARPDLLDSGAFTFTTFHVLVGQMLGW